MREIKELLFEILKELKIISKHLSDLNKKEYKAGSRFDL